jgi:TetR/AcrR family transcriptional regulator
LYFCTYINVKLMRKKVEKDTTMENQILDTAKRVFFIEGKLNATMQDIADELKVTRPVVNYYFRTKDMLIEKFYKEAVTCLSDRLNHVIDPGKLFYDSISNYIEDSLNSRDKYTYLDTFMVIEMNCRPTSADLSDYKVERLLKFLSVVKKEMEEGVILKTDPINFLFDMLSLITYPLVIGPLYKSILSMPDKDYKKVLGERKEIILKRLFVK